FSRDWSSDVCSSDLVAMGAVVHMGYSLRTAFRRAKAEHAARRAADQAAGFGHDTEPSMDGEGAPHVQVDREPVVAAPQRRIHAPTQYVEPSFEPSARIMAQPDYDDTAIDYPEESEDDIPFVPDTQVVSRSQRGDSRFHPVD